ncbi:pistil-specific extensin-like protein [Tasmannia lanceolata]|uniref:pistil-specific extensin-like protein n=1 Tax=Tasmannia lanceolata TaxID=3420 RepID=UPI00406409EE
MSFVPMSLVRALVLLQIFLFLSIATSDSVEGHGIAENPSAFPPRHKVAIEGLIYCKSCDHQFTPILGAVARLQCYSSKGVVNQEAITDKNGYYYIEAMDVTPHTVRRCQVFLVSSPSDSCKVPTNLHRGVTGASLRRHREFLEGPIPVFLFSVRPFAFEHAFCPRSP